jgi:hypothetical protein
MKPGIHDISEEEYHSLPLEIVSNSYLSRLNGCPASARVKMKDSETLIFGRAVHSYVLEGEAIFNARFSVAPTCDKRTTAGKQLWAKHMADNLGKTPLKEEEFVKIFGIDRAVKSHPFAGELLACGMPEQTAIWFDKKTGITVKCRPDWIPAGHNIIVDLKTCQSAEEYAFSKSVSTYRYFQQAGMYSEVYSKASGDPIDSFIFIAVEKEFPFRTEVYVMDPDYLAWGKTEYHRLLRKEKGCRDNGSYPHYVNSGATDLFMPKYLGLQ